MSIYTLYRITNMVNQKVYIGWTSRDPEIRFSEHQKHHKYPINHAIKKYGVNNFLFEIIYQSLDYDHSRSMESIFIMEHSSMIDQWGYNQDMGGTGHKRTKATIEKHREKISGRKQSPEHIAKRNSSRLRNGNPTAKTWIVTHPDGKEELVVNLRQFALSHNLDPSNLRGTGFGRQSSHKGYKAKLQ